MTFASEPTAVLSHLHRADGSATFSHNGYTFIGSVNGPIEVQRRDELPEEAVVDVVVRPAAGVGGTRERHLESLLQSTLRQVILIHNFPRTLIQLTLQITSTPEIDNVASKLIQADINLPILPALLQTAILTLLSASMPLATTFTSVLLALNSSGKSATVVQYPSVQDIQNASSIHVFAFTAQGALLLAESEGSFSIDDWNEAYEQGKKLCCGTNEQVGSSDEMRDVGEQEEASESMMEFLHTALTVKVDEDLHWKD
ncbi:hypothetical protein F5884DRAFT_665879 [Xylogone sp. PMI_703]|nr:hypothetical protein F5884DRAFT_665879 [Xylogone sp. PMI_703]